MNWKNKKVLVTGGASFIGSHLTEQLVILGAKVRVAENFSSGEKAHLQNIECELLEGDLLDQNFCQQATKGVEVLFHLAADHGGRGYIDSHQVRMLHKYDIGRSSFSSCSPKWSRKNRFCIFWMRLPNLRSNGCQQRGFPLRRHG